MRIKNRYIIAQYLTQQINNSSNKTFTSRDLQCCLRERIQELYGDIGSGDWGYNTTVRYLDTEYSHIFVIRCPREAEAQIHMALSCITKVRDVDLICRSLSIKSSARTCFDSLVLIIENYLSNCIDIDNNQRQILIESYKKSISLISA